MESLALLVSVILLLVVVVGPVALLFSRMGFVAVGAIIGVIAILTGGYWVCVAPFPVSLIGLLGLACGLKAMNKI